MANSALKHENAAFSATSQRSYSVDTAVLPCCYSIDTAVLQRSAQRSCSDARALARCAEAAAVLKARTAYVEELAAWVQDQLPKRRGQDTNAVAFLAVREDVEAAIAAGFPLTTIWRHLHETRRLGFRYDTFLKYVRKHVRRDAPAAPAQSLATSPPSPAPFSSSVPPPEPRRTDTTVPRFNFTAAADPKELF